MMRPDLKDVSVVSPEVAMLSFVVRPYCPSDFIGVTRLLHFLPELYPKGDAWLERRLHECAAARAKCWLVTFGCSLVGVLIETPKGVRRAKLSTIFVHPFFRRRGVGSQLISGLTQHWALNDIELVTVTVALSRNRELGPLLLAHNFSLVSLERNRYGSGRDELVYQWKLA